MNNIKNYCNNTAQIKSTLIEILEGRLGSKKEATCFLTLREVLIDGKLDLDELDEKLPLEIYVELEEELIYA